MNLVFIQKVQAETRSLDTENIVFLSKTDNENVYCMHRQACKYSQKKGREIHSK